MKLSVRDFFSWNPDVDQLSKYNEYFRRFILNKIKEFTSKSGSIITKPHATAINKVEPQDLYFPYVSWLFFKIICEESNKSIVRSQLSSFVKYKMLSSKNQQTASIYKQYACIEIEKELINNAQIECALTIRRDQIFRKQVEHGTHLLKAVVPDFFMIYEHLINEIVLLKGQGLISSSHPFIIGSIFLCPKPAWRESTYAELIVHETSHQILDLLLTVDCLIYNSEDFVSSPLRLDKRPLVAVLHATFVLKRICWFYHLLSQFRKLDKKEIVTYNLHIEKYEKGLVVLESNARWTENGKILLGSFRQS